MNNTSFRVIPVFLGLMFVSLLLRAAAVLNPSTMPNATIASYAVSTTNLENVVVAHAYRPWFENGAWQGDLVEYEILPNGTISTSVDLSTNPPSSGTVNWSARVQFDKKNSNYYQNQRKIITTNGTGVNASQIPFVWGSLTTVQQASIDINPVSSTSSEILDFIRGDRKNEVNGNPGGLLRQRYNILGDIIHSDPVYVAAPNSTIYDAGYSTYKTQKTQRAARVYVGANDGMLHAFNAVTGDEVYSYIPSMLISKLNLLSKAPYQHQYYVDGGLAAGDMDFGNSNWHSILVGSLGAGGKGLFALDISDPDLTDQSSTALVDNKILWELDGSIADIGYIYDKAEIVKLPDNNWYVVSGNGYGSSNDTASLLLINNLGVVTIIEADNTITANGLSRPALIDTNGDGAVDFAYAGDIQGNMYRFDLNTRVKADKLFSTGLNKPITTAPKITSHPAGGRIILFGTGSLLSKLDVNDVATQSIYGIRDFDRATLINNSNLLIQNLSDDETVATTTVRHFIPLVSATTMDWTSKDGWQVDLAAGERVVLDPNLRAGRFQVMSINPVLKEAWLIQLDYYDGTANKVFFDLNDDKVFDADDTINRSFDQQGNPVGIGEIPVAIKQGTGIFSRQLIIRISNGVDANFINGLDLPPVKPPCLVNCTAGFARGHIDVDTDSPSGGSSATNLVDRYCYDKGNRQAGIMVDAAGIPVPPSTNSPFQRLGPIPANNANFRDGLSGNTDGHQHEYDKAHGSVEVDYINLESYCKQTRADNNGAAKLKLNRVTEVGIGNSRAFFVIIANADLSPGSKLNIGNENWNVVTYQKLIQQKLDAWKTAGAIPADFASMMVDNGKSLIYTLDQILATVNAGTGKFSNSFNDQAIITGGLHPTQTTCVNKSSSITNGRWRNGALITQLIDVNNYINNPQTVVKQTPSDLRIKVNVNGVDILLKELSGQTYGGLYANNNSSSTGIGVMNNAFLYESTLFWHFGTLYDFVYGQKPCYGDTIWATAKSYELAGLSQAQLAIFLSDSTNALGKANKDLNDAIVAQASAATIQSLRNKLADELSKIKDYINQPGVGNPNNPNQSSSSEVPNMSRNVTVIVPYILGPNSTMGRRSWIDIRP